MVEGREHLRLAREARQRIASRAKSSGISLIATSRPSLLSVARYTSPMAPSPSFEEIL